VPAGGILAHQGPNRRHASERRECRPRRNDAGTGIVYERGQARRASRIIDRDCSIRRYQRHTIGIQNSKTSRRVGPYVSSSLSPSLPLLNITMTIIITSLPPLGTDDTQDMAHAMSSGAENPSQDPSPAKNCCPSSLPPGSPLTASLLNPPAAQTHRISSTCAKNGGRLPPEHHLRSAMTTIPPPL
jgi:hypothetical protein